MRNSAASDEINLISFETLHEKRPGPGLLVTSPKPLRDIKARSSWHVIGSHYTKRNLGRLTTEVLPEVGNFSGREIFFSSNTWPLVGPSAPVDAPSLI